MPGRNADVHPRADRPPRADEHDDPSCTFNLCTNVRDVGATAMDDEELIAWKPGDAVVEPAAQRPVEGSKDTVARVPPVSDVDASEGAHVHDRRDTLRRLEVW